jgi:hypothetical protein
MTKLRKETQGHKKLQQYLADLKRNKHFMAKIAQLRKINKSADKDKRVDQFIAILDKYKALSEEFEALFPEDDYIPHWKIYDEIAEEYGLDDELMHDILLEDIMGKSDDLGEVFDLATMRDTVDLLLHPEDAWKPPMVNHRLQTFLAAYPISINIHKFATKRDVLDYINKNWDIIVSYIESYKDGKQVRFRQRKLDRKISDFIWEHKNLSLKELKKELDKSHPNNGLVYNEIGKIISLEKRRRFRKIV